MNRKVPAHQLRAPNLSDVDPIRAVGHIDEFLTHFIRTQLGGAARGDRFEVRANLRDMSQIRDVDASSERATTRV